MATSATVGVLRVLLTANAAEFESAMKRASSSAKTWEKDLKSVGQQASNIGTALTKTLTVPLVGLGAGAIKMASDFESSFAGVRKTVDATEPEFAQLAQGLRNMSKEIPVNVNELNKVAEAAGQLGIKKEDILQFTRVMADLGVTTNLTADEAATATAQLQNIFGAAGKDVDRFGATLVALGNAGASTEKDIISMGLRIAGAGNQVGLSQAQVLSFASALSSVGINAEAGGSSISRTFLKINDAVMSGGPALAEFARVAGMTAAQFKTAFETDAASATVAFISGLSRLKGEGENVNATLEGLVGKNILIKDTLLRASGAGALLTDQLKIGNDAWKANSALTTEANERYKTFASQGQLTLNMLRDVGITIGNALMPAFRDLLTAMQPVVKALGVAAEWFGKLPEPVRTTAVVLGALVAAAGPAVFVLGQLALSASAVVGAFKAGGILAAAPGMIRAIGLAAMASAPQMAAFAVAAGSVVSIGTALRESIGLYKDRLAQAAAATQQNASHQLNLAAASKIAGKAITDLSEATRINNEHAAKLRAEQQKQGAAQQTVTGAVSAAVPPTKELAEATEKLASSSKKAAAASNELAPLVTNGTGLVVRSRQETARLREELEAWAFTNASVLAPSIQQVTAAIEEMEPLANTMKLPWVALKGTVQEVKPKVDGFFTQVFGSAQQFGTGISSIFQAAFTGGGGALGAVQSFATQTLSSLLGMIPMLGPFLSGFAGPIVAMFSKLGSMVSGFFRSLFGGPSGEEVRGRQAVAEFEAALKSTLTETQRLEAGNEAWKETVIAIRDAYLANGRTEAEALADAERLWQSSKLSAEEQAKVIAEIERKMQEAGDQAVDSVNRIGRALDSLPGSINIPVNIERQGDDVGAFQGADPGFKTGTLGRLGTFFGRFPPSGFLTKLHNTEAVITPDQSIPFAASVLESSMSGVPSFAAQPSAMAAMGDTVNTSSTKNSNVGIVVVQQPGESLDLSTIKREVFKSFKGAVGMDTEGMGTALDLAFENYLRTYGRG